jgi:catechol 2,3-dioxygenase-like lactoylglutathione lyase family enzyme
MTDVVTRVAAVTLHVRDVQKARTFYKDVLGLTEVIFDEKAQRAGYRLPDSPILLSMHVMHPGENGREPGTVTGLMFWVEDPIAACVEIKRRGGTIIDEPKTVEMPGAKFERGVFADPDGNEFLILNRPG